MDRLGKPNHRPAKPIYAPLPPSLHAAAAHCSRRGAPPPHEIAGSDILLDGSSGGRSVSSSESSCLLLARVGSGGEPRSTTGVLAPPPRTTGAPPRRASSSRLLLAMPSRRRCPHALHSLSLHRPSGAHDGFLVRLCRPGEGKQGDAGRGTHRGSCRPPRRGSAPAHRAGLLLARVVGREGNWERGGEGKIGATGWERGGVAGRGEGKRR